MPKIMTAWLIYNDKPIEITAGSILMLVLFLASVTYFTIKGNK